MNYQALWESARGVAEGLGYHPTLPSSLHKTLLKEGFPIAVIEPPKLLSTEGERTKRSRYRMSVKFLNKNELDDAARASSIASLAADAERFCALLSDEPHIFSLSLGEIVPLVEVLTIAGEVAVEMSADVESFECLM